MSSSDSDDTDILLLIPPDFFSSKADAEVQMNNDSESLKSHVVKGIINHINDLEDRVSTIETLDSAHTSYYSDSEMNNSYRNYLNSGAGGSLSRTPIKNRQNITCHSTPNHIPSPRTNQQRDNLSKSFSPQRSSNKAHESKKYAQEKLLNKIDDLYTDHKVSNTKLNESDNLGTSLDMDISHTIEGTLSNISTSPPPKESNYGSLDKLDLPKIERMLKQVEATQREFEEKLKQKEEDFSLTPKKTYNCGSNVQSVPDLNFGLRNLQYENRYPSEVQEEFVIKKQVPPSEEMANEPKAKRRLDLGAGGDLSPSAEITSGIQQLCKSNNYQPQDMAQEASSIPNKLLSLSELWRHDKGGESPYKSSNNNNVLRRKIEEEKYRREHCEQLIQQLQFRLLEEQEKVAVAMKVDSEKDKAIRTLQSGWAKLVSHWREIEEQRHDLTNRLLNEKQERQDEVTELTKKLERYEREVSQVVNLAAGYKEKAEKAESDKMSVQCEAQSALESMRNSLGQMEQALGDTRHKLEDYQRDRKMLADKLTLTEDELDKEKLLTKEVKDQLEELKITLKISKDRIETLEKNLEHETKKSRKLEQELQDARSTCEEVVKKEQKARDEIESLLAKSNQIKSELRDFYQNQLNTNVKEKLKEFQSQLDSAELTLHREFQQKEKTIVENAAKQLKQISEKLLFDFKTKCKAYESENQKLKCELALRDARIKEINQMLREESKKRELMAKKVESVMQSQLQQAIHMITSDVTQLHTSKESLTSQVSRNQSTQSLLDGNTTDANGALPRAYDQQGYSSAVSAAPSHQYADHMNVVEKDVTNNAADEMRKYIKMLLEKPPGNPVSDFEAEPKESGAGMTSFLESSVTSDIFNEHPPQASAKLYSKNQISSQDPKSKARRFGNNNIHLDLGE